MTQSKSERRSKEQATEQELYKADVDKFIAKERRIDELDRLREVKEQSRTWWKTIMFCGMLNLILLLLAAYGGLVK